MTIRTDLETWVENMSGTNIDVGYVIDDAYSNFKSKLMDVLGLTEDDIDNSFTFSYNGSSIKTSIEAIEDIT